LFGSIALFFVGLIANRLIHAALGMEPSVSLLYLASLFYPFLASGGP